MEILDYNGNWFQSPVTKRHVLSFLGNVGIIMAMFVACVGIITTISCRCYGKASRGQEQENRFRKMKIPYVLRGIPVHEQLGTWLYVETEKH